MNYVYIGKFEGTHGLKGEIKLKTDFKYIDKILVNNFSFYIGEEKTKGTLNTSRFHNGKYLISFNNLDDIDKVSKYINKKVYVLKEDLNLKEKEYVLEDYLNKECYFNDKYIGKVETIEDCGNNYVMQIVYKDEVLIPLNEHFIEKLDNDKLYLKNVEVFINED